MTNKNIGIIGYGTVGAMLVEGFIKNKIILEENLYISTRNQIKRKKIKNRFLKSNVMDTNSEVAMHSDVLFICVKPLEMNAILEEIKNFVAPKTNIVSTCSCIEIKNIEKVIKGKITKVIPSITSEVYEGVSLIKFNKSVNNEDKKLINELLNSISTVKSIKEDDFEIGADLTSSGPGLFVTIFDEYIKESLKHGNLSIEDSTDMVIETLWGTIKLIKEKKMSFEELLTRVATKGGITEEGAKVLKNRLPNVFKEMFDATLNKHEILKEKVREQFK